MSKINSLKLSDTQEEDGRDGRLSGGEQVPGKRSWSGNLGLSPKFKPNRSSFRKMRSRSNLGIPNSIKSKISPPPPMHWIHNRVPGSEAEYDSVPATPRLVRCRGMRRDWSFEDLRRALEG